MAIISTVSIPQCCYIIIKNHQLVQEQPTKAKNHETGFFPRIIREFDEKDEPLVYGGY